MSEIYVSTDIEADGPIPGPYSMLSLGSAAYRADKTLLATFSVNLETLPEATAHPDTMRWWEQFPEAWAACREAPRPPADAMLAYRRWLESLPGRPIFVGYPAAFDFMFVQWYLIRYTGGSPFAQSALDIKSYAMALLGREFVQTSKHSFPQQWLDPLPHTHVALDDALEQGALLCNLLAERRRQGAAGGPG